MKRARELLGIAMPADVHVHDPRRFVQHVVVQCHDFDAALLQLQHHGLDFSFRKDQISHDPGVVAISFEGSP